MARVQEKKKSGIHKKCAVSEMPTSLNCRVLCCLEWRNLGIYPLAYKLEWMPCQKFFLGFSKQNLLHDIKMFNILHQDFDIKAKPNLIFFIKNSSFFP